MSNRTDKPKLTPQKLVEKMRDEKGIHFKYISEQDVEDFLSNHNNYLRTACYRVCFPKYQSGPNKGKYIDLDFAYLKELPIIDMHYRFLVKKMCSDIEHFLCITLLKHIDNDSTTDGYDIAEQFLVLQYIMIVLHGYLLNALLLAIYLSSIHFILRAEAYRFQPAEAH